MAVIANSSMASLTWVVEPGTCVVCSDEQRLLDAGAARPMTEADKPDKCFDLDAGVWKLFKESKKKSAE